MNIKRNNLSETQVELIINVDMDEMKPFLEKAAKKLSLTQKIKGFRPGKATYDVIRQQLGEMAIYEQALHPIIDNTLLDAIKKEGIDFIGQPNIDVLKLAPENPLEYKVTVELMPSITLPENWKQIEVKVDKKQVKPEDKEKVIDNLTSSYAKQVLNDGKAEKGNKVILDFELSFDNVVPEDGKVNKFEVVLGENKMIPGFEDQLVGLKAKDEKTFELTFPKEYYNKKYQGKTGKFKVKINSVFTMEKPKLDDEFAKQFDFKTFKDFEEKIDKQLQEEIEHEAIHKAEVEMFEKLIEKSTFSIIPDTLIDVEKNKMISELKQNIMQQGLKYEDYLSHLKKTEDDLKKGFTDDAIKRIKSSLIIREVGKTEKLDVTDEEVQKEIEKAKESTQGNEELIKQIDLPQYKNYLVNQLATKKIVTAMKDFIIK